MSVCSNCQRMGDKLKDSLTQRERIIVLSIAIVMMRSLLANVNSPGEDRAVCNSVITKVLLSLDPQMRDAMIRQLRESAGVDVFVGSCAHGIQVIS